MLVPVVDEIWACSHTWVQALKHVWTLAETDPDVLVRLKGKSLGSVSEVSQDILISSVLRLQPPTMLNELDPYTLAVLQGVCSVARSRPSALQELLSGEVDEYTLENAHLELAWSIRKLQTNPQFRIRHKESSPISQLPVEILRLVFERLREAYPRYRKEMGRDVWDLACFLPSRRVCRHWTSVINETPSLWSPVVLTFGDRMTKLALTLSQNEPLDITVTDYSRRHNGVGASVAKILNNLSPIDLLRLRTLDAGMNTWDEMERVVQFLSSSPAPYLESLRIRPFVRDEDYRAVTIAPTIFSSTPLLRLHTLFVAECIVRLPNTIFQPCLRHLKLELCEVWSSLDDMIDTLSALRALESFSWNMSLNALDFADSEVTLPVAAFLTSARTPVHLSRMAELSLDCPTACVAALLSFVTIPPTCQVHILDDYSIAGEVQDGRAVERLMRSLRASAGAHLLRAFASGFGGAFHKVVVDEYPEVSAGRGALLIEAYSSCDTHATPHFTLAFVAAERTPGRLSKSTTTSILCEVLQWPSMADTVTIFETDHEVLADPVVWGVVLQSLPRIHSVHIDNDSESDASGSILGLSQALNLDSGLAPALRRIHLDGLTFPPPVQQHLALTCRSRYILGRTVVALTLQSCEEVEEYALEQILRAGSAGSLHLEYFSVLRTRANQLGWHE